MALAILMAMALQATPSADSGRAHHLAEQWVTEAEGGRDRWEKRLAPIEAALALQSQNALGLTDAQQKEKLRGAMHDSLQTLANELVEDRVAALTQTFSAEEIAGMLAFRHSAVGAAYAAGSQRIAVELATNGAKAPSSDAPKPSAEKLAMAARVLRAEGYEARLRRQVRMMSAALKAAESQVGNSVQTAPANSSATDAQGEAYVANIMTATTRLDAEAYSDEQLKELVAYFEGPIGRALIAQGPKLQSIATARSAGVLEHGIARAEDAGCQAITCDATQREKLNAIVAQVQKLMAASLGAQAR